MLFLREEIGEIQYNSKERQTNQRFFISEVNTIMTRKSSNTWQRQMHMRVWEIVIH